ncbi:hypothetical protein LINGRAHAP2_LOCUS12794 [Linum grandiflorum]
MAEIAASHWNKEVPNPATAPTWMAKFFAAVVSSLKSEAISALLAPSIFIAR